MARIGALHAFPENPCFTAAVYEMNAKTKNPEASWEVMSYLNSKEAMTYLAEGEKGVGALMPRKSALDALSEKEGVCDALKEVCGIAERSGSSVISNEWLCE